MAGFAKRLVPRTSHLAEDRFGFLQLPLSEQNLAKIKPLFVIRCGGREGFSIPMFGGCKVSC